MIQITNQQEFKDAIRCFLTVHNIGPTELARRAGVSRGVAEHWVYDGLKKRSNIDAVVAQYPWLFEHEGSVPEEVQAEDAVLKETSAPAVLNSNRNLLVLVKIEQARCNILCLAAILEWFLGASKEERNLFRDAIGDTWKELLWLTRAMTGETALEIAKQEGRPRKGE